MKFFSVIAIVFILSFRPLIPMVEYVVNYNKIITELCVNRAKSEMMCNGKCYLFDELSRTSDSQSSDGISVSTIKAQEFYLPVEIIEFRIGGVNSEISISETNYENSFYEFLYTKFHFQPPILS